MFEPFAAFVDGLLVNAPEWQQRASCTSADPETFYPGKGESTREAKRVCRGCEVRVECLEWALGENERHGVWGGLSELERKKIKRAAA